MDNQGTSGQGTQNSDQGSSDAAWASINAYLAQVPVSQLTDPSQSIAASASAKKLVERAISVIPRLESGSMYWKWRMVVEHELGKFCMSVQDQVATIHLTLSTTIRTNLHGTEHKKRRKNRLPSVSGLSSEDVCGIGR